MENGFLLSVPTSFGVESIVANEIRRLGYETETVEDGRVSFRGGEEAICRCNLWLRTAERVQIKVGEFHATTFDELFEGTKALEWGEVLPQDAVFPVSGHSLKSKLFSVPDCQSIVKKAIVDKLSQKYKVMRFPEDGSFYKVQFNILKDRVALYIDTSGEGLHKRGYRQASNIAPIRETLAAAIVYLSRWRQGMAFWDPFCGSGTIAIEAAMIGMNMAPGMQRGMAAGMQSRMAPGMKRGIVPGMQGRMAPGMKRGMAPGMQGRASPGMQVRVSSGMQSRVAPGMQGRVTPGMQGRAVPGMQSGMAPGMQCGFTAQTWGMIGKEYWNRAIEEAQSLVKGRADGDQIEIIGSDIEKHSVDGSKQNAKRAGVSSAVKFFRLDAANIKSEGFERLNEMGVILPGRGCIVGNPPYGERMPDTRDAEYLYGKLGEQHRALEGWGMFIISSNEDFEKHANKKADKKRKLYNGMIRCNLYQYFSHHKR